MNFKKVKKIGILRANALGDFIVTLPAIQSIRNSIPHAEIVLLGNPWHKSFLEETESSLKRTPVDRVVVIPITDGVREEHGQKEDNKELQKFFQEMSDEKFDILFSFHGKGIAANPFLKKCNPKITVGQSCPEAEKLDYNLDFYYYQSEMLRYLEIVSLIGIHPSSLEPRLELLPKDFVEANHFLERHNLNKFIVLHPAGTDMRRMWTIENFSRLADLLNDEGYTTVFSGSSADQSHIDRISSLMRTRALSAAGKLTLGGSAALFTTSKLVISVDTGPLHLARACGASTIGLYWAPNLINWGPTTRNTHRPVVSWQMHCPQCGIIPNDPYPFEPHTKNCDHNFSFIRTITPEAVMKEVFHLLKTEINSSVK